MTFSRSADGRITGHQGDRLLGKRAKRDRATESSGGPGCLDAGMTCPNNRYIESSHHTYLKYLISLCDRGALSLIAHPVHSVTYFPTQNRSKM